VFEALASYRRITATVGLLGSMPGGGIAGNVADSNRNAEQAILSVRKVLLYDNRHSKGTRWR
jgi:hypothetical protein